MPRSRIYDLLVTKYCELLKQERLTIARTIETNVSTLYEFYKKGYIKIDPALARGYMWTREDATRLIESLIMGLYVPPIIVAENHKTKEDILIDGFHRLETIRRFMDNELRLTTSVIPELSRKMYRELPPELRRRFENAVLTVVRIYLPYELDEETTSFIINELSRRINMATRPLTHTQLLFHGINTRISRKVRELASIETTQRLFNLTSEEQAEQLDKLVILGLFICELTGEPIPYMGKDDTVYITTILGYNPIDLSIIEASTIDKISSKIRSIIEEAVNIYRSDMFRGHYYGKRRSKFRPMIALALLYLLLHVDVSTIEKKLDNIIDYVQENYYTLSSPTSIASYRRTTKKLLELVKS